MLLPFDGRDERLEVTKILGKQLELERERLVCIINVLGIDSKEALIQSQLVDRLVVKYMKSMKYR